jgi:uncharacterized protein YggT (Ycf19 family)
MLVTRILCSASRIYSIVFVVWILFSWFSIDPESRLYPIYKVCDAATGWILRPLQRLLKPVRVGETAVDFTVLIPLLILSVVIPALLGCEGLF